MSKRRGRGEGNIYQRHDGRWSARLQVNGLRQAVYGPTKADVKKALTQLQADVADGAPIVADKSSVAEYLSRWLEDYIRPSFRRATYLLYEGLVRIHIKPRIGSTKLRKLRDTDIQRMLADMQRDGYSARRRQQAYTVIHKALKQAQRSRLIRLNPCDTVDKPKAVFRPPAFLKPEEVERFLRASRDDRNWSFYALAIATGLREGELLALWWADININDRTVAVTRTMSQDKDGKLVRAEPKTSSSRRLINLPQLAIDALNARKQVLFADGRRDESRYPWVFCTLGGEPLQKDVLLRQFKRALRAAGLPAITFHALRHTAASLRIAQGDHPKVIQEMLGHSSISTTLDIYGHLMPSLQRESADRFDQRFSHDVMAH